MCARDIYAQALSHSVRRQIKKQSCQNKTAHSGKPLIRIYAAAEGMGLCPIAPPKGFPFALWKPSAANTLFPEYMILILTAPENQ